MKTCPVCGSSDLHDDAVRCLHCRSWQSRAWRIFSRVLDWGIIAMVLLVICVIMAIVIFAAMDYR